MVIIGSKALNFYINPERTLHDTDLIMTQDELIAFNNHYNKYWVKTTNYSHVYDIEGDIVEVRNPQYLDATDKMLLNETFQQKTFMYGIAGVPTIQLLYDIKKSTALCIDEPKHKHDVELIEKNFPVVKNTVFFQKRLEETKLRTDKSKKNMYDFFHKYKLPEYVLHDRIHDMFADILGLNMPTYKRLTVDDTNISEELFNKLTHEQKVSLMAEESLVLSMERWFIPRMIEDGINYRLIDMWFNNNEAMPPYLILKHVNIKGLKGEAPYIVDFGRKYFFEIEQKWIEYRQKIRDNDGIPVWFLNELFTLRKKYLNKENVAIV